MNIYILFLFFNLAVNEFAFHGIFNDFHSRIWKSNQPNLSWFSRSHLPFYITQKLRDFTGPKNASD